MNLKHPIQIGAAIFRAVDELAEFDGAGGASPQPVASSQPALDPTEAEAVGHWLSEFSRFPGTYDEYFDEAVRLLFWTSHVRGVPVSEMTRRDALAYEIYLSTAKRGLSGDRQRLAVQVAVGVFGALQEGGYIESNPWTRRLARGAARTRPAECLPNPAQWQAVHTYVDSMPQGSLRDRQHFERLRWVLRFLHQTGLSAAIAAQVRANDFIPFRDRWRLRVSESGGIERHLAVSPQLMADFRRYRAFHGLPDETLTQDSGPAIRTITGKWHRVLTPTSIQLMVKGAFKEAATLLRATDPVGAAELGRAYAYWLRRAGSARRLEPAANLAP